MKKIALSLFTMFTFSSYAMYQNIVNKPAPIVDVTTEVVKPKDSLVNNKEVVVEKKYTNPVVVPVNKTETVITNTKPVVTTPIPEPVAPAVQTPVQSPVQFQTGIYKDGKYTGPSVDASYGNIQVAVTILGGDIIDVEFLDYPKGKQESVSKNLRAMPILISETIAIQDSNVDNVSGATFTSQAYRESLSSALAQAK